MVVRDTILEAWKEVLYLLTRFGRRVTLKKGTAWSCNTSRWWWKSPSLRSDEKLQAVNLEPWRLRRYQEDILKGNFARTKPIITATACGNILA